MINITMTEIKAEDHLLITTLGIMYIRTDGAVFTIQDSRRWVEIGPLPDSDREAELDWMRPEPNDEPDICGPF